MSDQVFVIVLADIVTTAWTAARLDFTERVLQERQAGELGQGGSR